VSEYPVGATRTTARVVEALLEVSEAGVTELATELGLSKGTVHNHLVTLERLGVVLSTDGRYRLGLGLLDAGMRVRDSMPLYTAAREELRELAASTDESACLVITERDKAVHVDVRRPHRNADRLRTGSRVPLHATAAGKVLLASRPSEAVDRYVEQGLAPYTDRTTATPSALRRELRAATDRGLAFDRGELFDGMRGVAAPVEGESGTLGALAVYGPAERLSGKRLDEDLPGLVLSAAKALGLEAAE
jgi:DNA-binding IclR family transcriptional regulator